MFSTLMVANRGEIALRVMRTAARMGIRTVALYTDLDLHAPHVLAADEAVRVDNYLDIDGVVAAARSVGADAVHPGYGFLSERAGFARALEDAGIILVGPSSAVMDQMGRKDQARTIAVDAGVPVVPAYSLDTPPDELAYPVLIKAAAGGGGKGMRIVHEPGEYAAAVAAAGREARAGFGDDTLLIEKYVEHGRHIEVQVLADSHGNVVHLFERDCSSQRRHQKVLEEAPAPTITPQVRELVTGAAVALADRVGYRNAGTVEFLLDVATDEAYFLEMNTRLQVEHPVTEAVVRVAGEPLDLVELQLRVASGERLGFDQAEVSVSGHAIEARVYAEDAFGGFLPQAGTATLVRWPSGARVDAALVSGQVVSTAYDPMLGKVITYGPDRESARRTLVAALDDTAILGLTTNVGFLRVLADSAEFRDAAVDTAWLDHNELAAPSADVARIFVAWIQAMLAAGHDSAQPFRADGWRSGSDPAPTRVDLDRTVVVDRARGRVDEHEVKQLSAEQHRAVLSIDGRRDVAVVNVQRDIAEVCHRGQRFVFERPDRLAGHRADDTDGQLVAPMPGTVLSVSVAVGQDVAEGDTLGVIEAMKMELALKAPFAGRVTGVEVSVGQQVAMAAPLFVVVPAAADADHAGSAASAEAQWAVSQGVEEADA